MPEKKAPKVKVMQDENAPVEKGVLAQAIVDIAKAATQLSRAGIGHNDLVALIVRRGPSRLTKTAVSDTLSALDQLRRDYSKGV